MNNKNNRGNLRSLWNAADRLMKLNASEARKAVDDATNFIIINESVLRQKVKKAQKDLQDIGSEKVDLRDGSIKDQLQARSGDLYNAATTSIGNLLWGADTVAKQSTEKTLTPENCKTALQMLDELLADQKIDPTTHAKLKALSNVVSVIGASLTGVGMVAETATNAAMSHLDPKTQKQLTDTIRGAATVTLVELVKNIHSGIEHLEGKADKNESVNTKNQTNATAANKDDSAKKDTAASEAAAFIICVLANFEISKPMTIPVFTKLVGMVGTISQSLGLELDTKYSGRLVDLFRSKDTEEKKLNDADKIKLLEDVKSLLSKELPKCMKGTAATMLLTSVATGISGGLITPVTLAALSWLIMTPLLVNQPAVTKRLNAEYLEDVNNNPECSNMLAALQCVYDRKPGAHDFASDFAAKAASNAFAMAGGAASEALLSAGDMLGNVMEDVGELVSKRASVALLWKNTISSSLQNYFTPISDGYTQDGTKENKNNNTEGAANTGTTKTDHTKPTSSGP